MRKFNKREKILIGAFGVVLVFYLISTYLISPIIEKIDELKKQQAELRVEWDAIKNWVGKEDQLKKRVNGMETEVNELVQKFPPGNQSGLYWDAFNRIGRESGVMITRMVEESGKTGSVILSVSGTETAVLQFLNRLQTMTYVTAVKAATIDYQETSVLATLQLGLGSR